MKGLGLFIFGFTILFFSTVAFAKNNSDKNNDRDEAAAIPMASAANPNNGTSRLKIGGSVEALEGLQSQFGYGARGSYSFRLDGVVPVYFGMDVGFSRFTAQHDTTTGDGATKQTVTSNADITALDVLATLYYRFLDYGSSKAHPYLGFSVGPSLMYSSIDGVKFGDTTLSNKSNSVLFKALLRPGVDIDVMQGIGVYFEPTLGIFNGRFLFAPSAGAMFSF